MLTDYFNNRIVSSFNVDIAGKWYGIAWHKGRSIIGKIDSFLFISLKNNSVLEMTFVSFDNKNRKKVCSFCGEMVGKEEGRCLISARPFVFKKYLELRIDDNGFLIVSRKGGTRICLFSKKIPTSKPMVDKALQALHLDSSTFYYNVCNVV
ncbi:MAG: hypothetical protein ACI358_08540 [Candidatus Limimorpha sp.]